MRKNPSDDKIRGDVQIVAIDNVQQHPDNPRRGDVEAIRSSIRQHGFYGAVVVQKSTGYIIKGNHVWAACKAEGVEKIRAEYVDYDDSEAMEVVLMDNWTSDQGSYDYELLLKNLDAVKERNGSLEHTGYSDDVIKVIFKDLKRQQASVSIDNATVNVDQAAELQKKWNVKLGQLWQIGEHKLLCGDATNADDVTLLLNGDKPNLMVTDPPYGVRYDANWRNEEAEKKNLAYAARRIGKVENDDRADWSEAWALSLCDVAYVWHASWFTDIVKQSIEGNIGIVRNLIVWHKFNFAISRGHYNWMHELCWYAVRDGATASWIGDKTARTVWDDITLDTNVEGGHSTQKPIQCMARPIRNHEGDVYDPFLGSGTTMVAAEQLSRKCYGIDIEPKYCAVTLERMSTLGIQGELIDG